MPVGCTLSYISFEYSKSKHYARDMNFKLLLFFS